MTATPLAGRPPGRTGRLGGEAWLGLAFVVPIIAIMGGLVFLPVISTLVDSLYRIDPMRAGTPFVGLGNYTTLAGDANVRQAWFNTLVYVVIAVLLQAIGGLGAALLLNRVRTGRRWLLAALVLPWCLPPVVNALVWLWIYNPSVGLLNSVLQSLGIIETNKVWFNDRTTALFLIALVHVWRMLPLTAIILLAALQSIPKELYEAAKLDGAGPIKAFRMVTLPLISGGIAIALSQSTVFAFNLFDEAWILAGSSLDTRTVIIQVYMSAFQNLKFSLGMALSVLAMIASLLVSLVYVLRVYRETRFE
ncbi:MULTISPECIES: carbohydrate ABC transporter permease [unclassified Aureimonas]|uniref:carbohydrate ABC transporter permease n=1 Tax=unclassified Aureimonas TaxID=2615206 RepID=UPI0006FAF309|nr:MULTISPECIES: sugar ABC transporter permease [unclassified Aureimonas]KQT65773.1 ABC transporter permease [Aureimonas sp. Leaf427]KQT74773.1 ABC transporter permease [Aureimonas sp. Leaf460]